MPPVRWLAVLSAIALFFLVQSGKYNYALGDSRYSTLASLAILEHGSAKLDPYVSELSLKTENFGHDWMVYHHSNGHFYYDYPMGTPIFSLPFVGLAKIWGYDPLAPFEDVAIQLFLAGFCVVAVFLLLLKMAELFLEPWPALFLALMLVLGSQVMSTMALALWSHDFQTVFVAAIFLEIAESLKGKRPHPRPLWMGFLLFSAWFCRPTTMFLVALALAWMFWQNRKAGIKASLTALGLLLLFVLWSWLELGQVLPRYYLPGHWKAYGSPMANLGSILWGPARGLLAFTPWIILGLAGWAFRSVRREKAYWMIWLWMGLHTYMILQSKNPWGGWCYGPRFYTEMVPAFALALLLSWEAMAQAHVKLRKGYFIAVLTMLTFSVFVHTWQGMFNPATQDWNDKPNIDQAWAVVRNDWRYPQFMAHHSVNNRRFHENLLGWDVGQLLLQIAEQEALLYGFESGEKRGIFRYWNQHKTLDKQRKVFNSIGAAKKEGFTEIWFPPDLLDTLSKDWRIAIQPFQVDTLPDSTEIEGYKLQYPTLLKGKFRKEFLQLPL